MEALLLTIGVIVVMVLALVVLGWTWPSSSRMTGYRTGRGAGRSEPVDPLGAPGEREDDEARWDWPDGEAGPDAGAPDAPGGDADEEPGP